ncbi:MAG: MFS transporter [Treponema sp.]|jgi:NNP family nitrate/nitrite transporter-like MFS transporter|nr:MFS transporter [Treponema sp.]
MSEKVNKYRWVILSVASFAIFVPNYAQYQLSPLAPQIIGDLGLSPSQFTSIFTATMIPAIFLSIVSGLLADKFGIKRIIGIGMLLSSAGLCMRIISNDFTLLFLSMVLSGFGGAFLNTNGAKIMGIWFPPEKIGAAMGIFLAASTLSMTVGMGTTAMLNGIRTAYLIAAILSIVALILWALLIKNSETERPQGGAPKTLPISECLGKVVKNRIIWFVGICLMFILGANVIIGSFLPTILAERGIDIVSAGMYGSAVTIGNFLGCLFIPIVASRIANKPVLFILAVISAAGAAFGWQAPQGIALVAALCVTGIAMGGLMPLLMSMPIQLPGIGPAYAGTAGGFTATLQLIGAVVIPTYIAGPIAGTNIKSFFAIAGICMIMVFIFGFGLPELGKKKQAQ